MTSVVMVRASTDLLMQLANPAARSLALGCAAGLGLAAFRVKNTSLLLFAWNAVLYAAIGMPLLGWLLPPLQVSIPAFSNHHATQQRALVAAAEMQAPAAFSKTTGAAASSTALVRRNETSGGTLPRPSLRWNEIAATIYLAVALSLLVRFFLGLALGSRLLRASQQIDDPRVTRRLAAHAAFSAVSLIPRAGESELISVPVTMGVLRPMILLPPGWREWDDAKLDAVVAHEMSHVARRDALTQRLSLLHRAIFWFSPLAWWLDRHLADLAEQASDEAALSGGADRTAYAQTLLGFFEALHAAPGRVWWQGVSMAKSGQAEQRIERILAWKGTVAMNLKKSIAAFALVLALPAVYLAASVSPAATSQQPQSAIPAQEPTPPTPPSPSRRARAAKSSSGRGFSYAFGYDDEQRFIIVSGKSDSLTMSGTTGDAEMVEELKKTIPGDFIWFERNDQSYIIRDQATIDRAKKLWAPQDELGKKQEELGAQQEVLGQQQEELSAKMEQIQVKVPDMTAEIDKLKAELQQLNSGATVEQVGNIQSEIGDLQSKIGELQSQAGEQQSKLGDQLGTLGDKQGKLGEQQGELGRQQGELAQKAAREMKRLIDEALTKGTATPLKPSPASL